MLPFQRANALYFPAGNNAAVHFARCCRCSSSSSYILPARQRCSRELTAEGTTPSRTSHSFSSHTFSFSADSLHEGAGRREEPRRILVQRREQGREDRGGGQREDQEDRRREREFLHCQSCNPISIDRSVSNDPSPPPWRFKSAGLSKEIDRHRRGIYFKRPFNRQHVDYGRIRLYLVKR